LAGQLTIKGCPKATNEDPRRKKIKLLLIKVYNMIPIANKKEPIRKLILNTFVSIM
jgi:hypothetical protein